MSVTEVCGATGQVFKAPCQVDERFDGRDGRAKQVNHRRGSISIPPFGLRY